MSKFLGNNDLFIIKESSNDQNCNLNDFKDENKLTHFDDLII